MRAFPLGRPDRADRYHGRVLASQLPIGPILLGLLVGVASAVTVHAQVAPLPPLIDPSGRSGEPPSIEKKTPLVQQGLPDEGAGWQVSYALFGRWGFKADTRALAEKHHCLLVDLKRLDHDIGH